MLSEWRILEPRVMGIPLEEQLRQWNAAKEQACLKEINLALERHGCVLTAVPIIERGMVVARPVVAART